MKNAALIVRILLGAAFVAFGLNYWLKFMPTPGPPNEQAGAFMGALFASGFLQVVKVLEVIGGLCLLSGRLAPLGLTLLGPVLVVILLYDVFLAQAFNPVSTGLSVMALFLLYCFRGNFRGLLSAPRA